MYGIGPKGCDSGPFVAKYEALVVAGFGPIWAADHPAAQMSRACPGSARCASVDWRPCRHSEVEKAAVPGLRTYLIGIP
jgi:hypothetical protein